MYVKWHARLLRRSVEFAGHEFHVLRGMATNISPLYRLTFTHIRQRAHTYTHKHTHTHTHTHRHTYTQTHRYTHTHTDRHTHRQTDRQIHTQTQTDIQAVSVWMKGAATFILLLLANGYTMDVNLYKVEISQHSKESVCCVRNFIHDVK